MLARSLEQRDGASFLARPDKATGPCRLIGFYLCRFVLLFGLGNVHKSCDVTGCMAASQASCWRSHVSHVRLLLQFEVIVLLLSLL